MRALIVAIFAAIIFAPTAGAEWLVTSKFHAHDDPTVTSEILYRVNEVAEEYPEVRGVVVTTMHTGPGIYSYAEEKFIVFNEDYVSDPGTIQVMIDADVRAGFHPQMGRCTGPQFLAYHESAHVIDWVHHRVAQKQLSDRFGDGNSLRVYLSGYSFNSRGLDVGEALAEAFAAVRCGSANFAERELNRMLVGNA